MSKHNCTTVCPLIYAEKQGWVIDISNYPSPFGDITLFNNSDGKGTWLQYKKGPPISESEWCSCADEGLPQRKTKEDTIIAQQKTNRLKQNELYPILHFLAQNYEPPITDEEMAAQLN